VREWRSDDVQRAGASLTEVLRSVGGADGHEWLPDIRMAFEACILCA